MPDPRHESGQRAEALAAAHLAACGCEILLRNFRRRLGELDIVACRDGVLIIAEVRTRATARYGGAAASVTPAKQRRIVRAASALLQQRPELARLPVRFDVVVVSGLSAAQPTIEWIQHAFVAG